MGPQAKAQARNTRPSARRRRHNPLMILSNRIAPEGISIRWSSIALDPAIVIETQLLRLAKLKRPVRSATRTR
jgi:hypothetical protein